MLYFIHSSKYIVVIIMICLNQYCDADEIEKEDNFSVMVSAASLAFISFFIISIIRGNDLYKPFFYLKRKGNGYIYGYNVSILNTSNTYNKKKLIVMRIL